MNDIFNETVIRTRPPLGKPLHFLGNLLVFRAAAADTEGSFSLVEVTTAPGAGAPAHRQTDEEAFLVLEGQYEYRIGETTRLCGPGEFVHVKPGVPHAFRNPTDRPARMLVMNLPGGPHESFFLSVCDPVADGVDGFPQMTPPDMERIGAAAVRAGIAFLPQAVG